MLIWLSRRLVLLGAIVLVAACASLAPSSKLAPIVFVHGNGDTAGRGVVAEFNGERIAGRAWPTAQGHVVILELTY